MDIPDMGCTKFILLPQNHEALSYSFSAKRAALGPYIAERWGWDDDYQIREHQRRFEEKPFFKIVDDDCEIGTVSLMRQADYVRFGEFYLFPQHQGKGTGSKILHHCISLAERIPMPVRLEYLKWNPVGSLYRRNGFLVIGETDIHWLMERKPTQPSP